MREGDRHDGLLALGALKLLARSQRDMLRDRPTGQGNLGQRTEAAVDELDDRRTVERAADADDDIVGHDEGAMQRGEVGRLDPGQRLGRAAGVDGERMFAEVLTLQPQAGLLDDVILSLAAGGDDRRTLQGEGLRQDLRTQDAVGDQFGNLGEIGAQRLAPEAAGDL